MEIEDADILSDLKVIIYIFPVGSWFVSPLLSGGMSTLIFFGISKIVLSKVCCLYSICRQGMIALSEACHICNKAHPVHSSMSSTELSDIKISLKVFEPSRRKTNNVVSEQV